MVAQLSMSLVLELVAAAEKSMLASMERHWNDLRQPPKYISSEQIGDMTAKTSVVALTSLIPLRARPDFCLVHE